MEYIAPSVYFYSISMSINHYYQAIMWWKENQDELYRSCHIRYCTETHPCFCKITQLFYFISCYTQTFNLWNCITYECQVWVHSGCCRGYVHLVWSSHIWAHLHLKTNLKYNTVELCMYWHTNIMYLQSSSVFWPQGSIIQMKAFSFKDEKNSMSFMTDTVFMTHNLQNDCIVTDTSGLMIHKTLSSTYDIPERVSM